MWYLQVCRRWGVFESAQPDRLVGKRICVVDQSGSPLVSTYVEVGLVRNSGESTSFLSCRLVVRQVGKLRG